MGKQQTESMIKAGLRKAADVLLETVWPTRCAVCDMPGESVLCHKCAGELRFIDLYGSCPRCGAPYGTIQCTECNDVTLGLSKMDRFPFDTMSSALIADDAAKRIVKIYKDNDERRLSKHISEITSRYISPDRISEGCVITYVPDSLEAVRRRGFDHSLEIAQCVAKKTGMRYTRLFERPKSKDQRKLGRRERVENMQSSMKILNYAKIPESVMVIDDICTTGATLYSAGNALRHAGAEKVHALTFARVLD